MGSCNTDGTGSQSQVGELGSDSWNVNKAIESNNASKIFFFSYTDVKKLKDDPNVSIIQEKWILENFAQTT